MPPITSCLGCARARYWTTAGPFCGVTKKMPTVIYRGRGAILGDGLDDKDNLFPFALDITVLRAVFDAVNRLRVAGGGCARHRRMIQEKLPKFDDFDRIYVCTWRETRHVFAGRRMIYLSMYFKDSRILDDWDCRVSEDWILVKGISQWRVYDGRPLINPARIKWHEVVRWMNAVRPYAWHWFEEHQKSTCADGARGRARDFAAFENDFHF